LSTKATLIDECFYNAILNKETMQLPAHREDPGVRYVAGSFVVGVFLPSIAGGITFPLLSRLELVLGLSPAVVGLILSTADGVRLLSNAPIGSLLDRVGTRRPLITGFLLLTVAPFGYALGMDPGPVPLEPAVVFVVSAAVAGLGAAMVLVGGYTMITDITTPENRGRWLGYMLGSYGLGFPIGLVIGGVVADAYGIREAFLLGGVVSLISLPIVFALVPDKSPEVDQDRGIRQIPALVRADRRLAVIGTINGILSFLSRAFLTTVVVFIASLGLELSGIGDMGVTGVMLALVTLAASGSTLVAGRYSDSFDDRISLVLPSLCVMAVGFVTVAMVPTLAGIVAGGVVAAVGGGAAGPVLKAYLGDISPSGDVAKLGGAYDVFGDLGGILGPVIALPAASRLGFDAVYFGCAGLGVVAAVLVATTLLSAAPSSQSAVAE
jgi:MFS family permease